MGFCPGQLIEMHQGRGWGQKRPFLTSPPDSGFILDQARGLASVATHALSSSGLHSQSNTIQKPIVHTSAAAAKSIETIQYANHCFSFNAK